MSISADAAFTINVYNPLFSSSYIGGRNLLTNGSFDTYAGGFTGWTEDTDSGNVTIAQGTSSPSPQNGTGYCSMYAVNGGAVYGHVYQNVTVTPESYYRLTLWSRISTIYASQQGRVAVYDVSNSQWIISRENSGLFSSLEWQMGSYMFTAPVGCTSIRIYLYQGINATTYVYYDNVRVEELQPGKLTAIGEGNDSINSYQHTTSANMGFDVMSMSTVGDTPFIEEWVESGLARHIEVTESGGGVIWEGFVNKIDVSIGGFKMSIGPLKDMINRAKVTFNQIDWNVTPPVGGDQVTTQWRDDPISMARFGVLEGILTGGEGKTEEMDDLISSLLPEIAWPASESSFSLGGSGIDLRIECLGYGHLLDKYYYSQQAVAGEQNASSKVKAILLASPNNVFDFSDASIDKNEEQVGIFEDGQKTAMAILKDISNMGGVSPETGEADTRFIFGVYKKRIFEYRAVSPRIVYRTRLTDGRIENEAGGFPAPWTIMPGVWMKIDDAFIGKISEYTRPSEDPSKIFIESVTYNAPYGISIRGGRASTFRKRIERLGIGGI